MAVEQDNVVRVKKKLQVPVATAYELFADDDFFDFCGADIDDGEYDFRVGGKYAYEVDEDDFFNGEFKEIVENERIVFTWFTKGYDGPTGETLVAIAFKSLGEACEVELVHTGIRDRKTAKGHDEGWIEILEAIGEELAAP